MLQKPILNESMDVHIRHTHFAYESMQNLRKNENLLIYDERQNAFCTLR